MLPSKVKRISYLEEFVDDITGKLMTDPVLILVDDSLKVVDRKNVKSSYRFVAEQPLRKEKIRQWNAQLTFLSSKTAEKDCPGSALKIIVVGSSGVGKTELLNAFEGKEFSSDYKKNNSVEERLISRELLNGKVVNLTIYESIPQAQEQGHWKNADAVIFVADITSCKSFEAITGDYIDKCNEHLGKKDYTKVLVLNKSDSSNERVISRRRAETFANTNGITFYETSLKTKECEKVVWNSSQNKFSNEIVSITDILSNTIDEILINKTKKPSQTKVNLPSKEVKQQASLHLVTVYNSLLVQIKSFLAKEIARLSECKKQGEFKEFEQELIVFKELEFNSEKDLIDESKNKLHIIINQIKIAANRHRESYEEDPINYFAKANWLRKTKSANNFKDFVNEKDIETIQPSYSRRKTC